MLSLGIDVKKDILRVLDEIELELDQNDPKVINEKFIELLKATVSPCINNSDYHSVLVDSLKIFKAIA